MSTAIITRKTMTVYVAYAPEFDMGAYGSCWEEAFNTLNDEIRQHKKASQATAHERNAR